MWKEEKLRAISPLFHIILYIFLTSGVKLHIHLLNVVVQSIVFLTLSTLICRGTDISKCFSESLGIRDNESRLYSYLSKFSDVIVIFTQAKQKILYGTTGVLANNFAVFELQLISKRHNFKEIPYLTV